MHDFSRYFSTNCGASLKKDSMSAYIGPCSQGSLKREWIGNTIHDVSQSAFSARVDITECMLNKSLRITACVMCYNHL